MIAAFFRRLWDVFRDGVRLWWLVPIIPLISALPEFAQHIAEIRLGMFEGGEAARAAAENPLRFAFGYGKIAGLLLAMIFAARFWATRKQGLPWWSARGIVWPAVLGSIALQLVFTLLQEFAKPAFGDTGRLASEVVVSFAMLPLYVWLAGGLLGDRPMTLVRSYTRGWGAVVRIAFLSLIPFGLGQAIHVGNHVVAMGQPMPLVWALMVWDSLVVGTMAAWMGTALHHGYAPLRRGDDSRTPETSVASI